MIVFSDITALKERDVELAAINRKFDVAVSNLSQEVCLYDAEGRLQVFNRRFCEIFRLPSAQVVGGMPMEKILDLGADLGNHPAHGGRANVLARVSGKVAVTTILDLPEDRVVALAHRPLEGGGWIETYEDVTDRLQSEAKVVYMARHDALTGLPNRLLLTERVETALGFTARGSMFALLMLGLDHFKQVNDALGHAIGDAVLRLVADRLSACVREIDVVARLGGDEFAIVQSDLENAEQATVLARRIVDAMRLPFELEGHVVVVGASIGISMAPSDGTSYAKLLKNADVALHKAKSDGRGTWRFFEAEMDARRQARRSIEVDIRWALSKRQFEVYYQSLFDLQRNRIG